eukprot:1969151-Lingulodinium_polyedra.AAC.1
MEEVALTMFCACTGMTLRQFDGSAAAVRLTDAAPRGRRRRGRGDRTWAAAAAPAGPPSGAAGAPDARLPRAAACWAARGLREDRA